MPIRHLLVIAYVLGVSTDELLDFEKFIEEYEDQMDREKSTGGGVSPAPADPVEPVTGEEVKHNA